VKKKELAREVLKDSYEFGFEVGYHNHDESYGWVEDRKLELAAKAREADVLKEAARYFKKGMVDGATKKSVDISTKIRSKPSERWEVYKRVLDTAWADDAMTVDEENALRALARALELGKDDLADLSVNERIKVYEEVLLEVWQDAVVTHDEQSIVEELADALSLSSGEIHRANRNIRRERDEIKLANEIVQRGPDLSSNQRLIECVHCRTKFVISDGKVSLECPKCGETTKV